MIELALDSDKSYTTTLTLGEEDYIFSVYWAERLGSWFFDISDAEGVVLRTGQRIATDTQLSASFADVLPGRLLSLSSEGADVSDPGETDLGERVGIFYVSADELV